ncbi:MAG: MoaD/ThiS family protein [Anaerolineae bacterium]|jgi:molybdopterin converting factor small subunit|nr:MoaD/ThiS family protein [Anaerolineae bacterium]MDH7474593.1 MoaD/ThiS family protein [Anaerolineae bacterium]
MQVEIQVYGELGGLEGRAMCKEVNPGTTLADIAQQLHIPLEEVGFIVVDGRVRSPDYQVMEGQRVCFFPPVMGG